MPLPRATLERLIDVSPDIVVATDASGKVAFYNDGAAENLGYSREEIIGSDVTVLYLSRDEAKKVMRAMRDPASEKGRVVNFPTTFVANDGHEIPVAVSGVILYDEQGDEEGTIGFAKDLSEIIRKDQLAVLGEIAVGLSHEINNPLAVITFQIAMLERFVAAQARVAGQEAERERIAAVRREIGRIEGLVQRLAEMARHEEYSSTTYVGDARMIDLQHGKRAASGLLTGRRILVVDDDASVREACAETLVAEGSEVVQATDGLDALDKLEQEPFDLVLSDVVMPDMDGYELYSTARKRFPGIPVALMTAFYHDRDHVIKRSRMEGLEGVLFKKPIDPERLVETLSRLITPPQPVPS
jgi:PAS domain S-box-containing protein